MSHHLCIDKQVRHGVAPKIFVPIFSFLPAFQTLKNVKCTAFSTSSSKTPIAKQWQE